jgi:chaperonin cofactor prefoldin
MSALYELAGQFNELWEMIDDTELDEDVILDTLEAIDGEIEVKADNYAKVIRNMDVEIEGIKSEIERLTKKKRTLENRQKNLKDNLQQAMESTGKRKFKTELFGFNIQKNPASVELKDVKFDKIDAQYLVWPEPTVDKKKVKEALQNGEQLEWATLVQKESLRIR